MSSLCYEAEHAWMRTERPWSSVEQRGAPWSAIERLRAPWSAVPHGHTLAQETFLLSNVCFTYSVLPCPTALLTRELCTIFIFLAFSDGHILEFIPY